MNPHPSAPSVAPPVGFTQVCPDLVSHGWERRLEVPGFTVPARLNLLALGDRTMRGSVHVPGHAHLGLTVTDGGRVIPSPADDVTGLWITVRELVHDAAAQMLARAAGQPHRSPVPAGDDEWEASVQRRLDLSGAPPVPAHLPEDGDFTPRQVIVYATTHGYGRVHLFGEIDRHSATGHFSVSGAWRADFHQPNALYRVPEWLWPVCTEVTGRAWRALSAAEGRLVR